MKERLNVEILYEQSAGDVKLWKFVMYFIPKIGGIDEKYYDDKLGGYLYAFDYFYNVNTRDTNDSYLTHVDIIDSIVSYEVKKETRDQKKDVTCGKTDYYLKDKFGNHPIRMWFSGDKSELTHDKIKYLQNMFCANRVIL